jgi:hypothetical protein
MVNKHTFEQRGAKGSVDSYYILSRTSCCGNVGVQDIELHEFYYDPTNLKKVVNAYYSLDCPFCYKYRWELSEVSNVTDLPMPWAWAVS